MNTRVRWVGIAALVWATFCLLGGAHAQGVVMSGLSPAGQSLYLPCAELAKSQMNKDMKIKHNETAVLDDFRPIFEQAATAELDGLKEIVGFGLDLSKTSHDPEMAEFFVCVGNARVAQLNGSAGSAEGGAAQSRAGAGQLAEAPAPVQQPQSAPAQSASSPAAMGDVFGRCVSLHAEEKRGIQDYWSLSNDCGETVIARYCFKANFETAGNEALCSQLEYRTTEIKANSKLDFTFSLEEPGTPRTDGTISGANALSVLGYACTGGSFPQIGFEDKRLKFQGCS